jgi:hypothetical protein
MLAIGVCVYSLTAFLDAQTLFDALRGWGTGMTFCALLLWAMDKMRDGP